MQLWFQVNVTVEPLSVLPGTGVAMVAAPLMQEPLLMEVTSLAALVLLPPPEALAELVTLEGAVLLTFTVKVMGG